MTNASSPNCDSSAITVTCTVDALIAKSPVAVAVLNDFGIDTCCGGTVAIGDAAAHARVDPAIVIGALEAALRDGTVPTPRAVAPLTSCNCGCR